MSILKTVMIFRYRRRCLPTLCTTTILLFARWCCSRHEHAHSLLYQRARTCQLTIQPPRSDLDLANVWERDRASDLENTVPPEYFISCVL